MTAIKRKYNSKEKIIKKLKNLISELNEFTLEVEHWKMDDVNYSIQINETERKERRFLAKLKEVKITTV